MRDVLFGFLIALIVFINLIGFMAGAFDATSEWTPCTYNSIATRTNLGYVTGCFLFENRF